MICFDYHKNCRGGRFEKLSVLREKAQPSLKEFDLFFAKGDQIVRYPSHFTVLTAEKDYVTGLVSHYKKIVIVTKCINRVFQNSAYGNAFTLRTMHLQAIFYREFIR